MSDMKFLISLLMASFSTSAITFDTAKRHLDEIYKKQPQTFYCGCDIDWIPNNKGHLKPIADHGSCGYKARKPLTAKGKVSTRPFRIEWEHTVSAEEFGKQLGCWNSYVDKKGRKQSARKACQKNSGMFKIMEGDLHNLVPAIAEVNQDRKNFRFNMISGEARVYGQCNAEVDFKRRVFEPSESVQGDIARAYLYFESVYGLRISRKQKQLFNSWNITDPVSREECKMHNKKAKIMGQLNPYVADQCKSKGF